jgi:hypothetical protein
MTLFHPNIAPLALRVLARDGLVGCVLTLCKTHFHFFVFLPLIIPFNARLKPERCICRNNSGNLRAKVYYLVFLG